MDIFVDCPGPDCQSCGIVKCNLREKLKKVDKELFDKNVLPGRKLDLLNKYCRENNK